MKSNKILYYFFYIGLSLFVFSCGSETKNEEKNTNPISDTPYPTDTTNEVKDSIPESEFEKYAFIDAYSEGLAKVRTEDGKYGYINEKRKEVIETIYDEAKNFSEGFAAVKKDRKWSFINKEGKKITSFIFDDLGEFREGLATVTKNKTSGYIDTTGKIRITFQYEWAGDFVNGLARVSKDKKWGFINRKNQVIIPILFDAARDFQKGFAALWTAGKWGYLDEKGDTLIDFQFDRVEDFNEEKSKLKAKVTKDGKTYYINPKGECVENCQ